MKIAFVITSLAKKGPALVVQDIINNLPKSWDITIFHFDDIVELKFSSSIKIKKISFLSNPFFLSKYDVVHSHLLRPDIYCGLYSLFYNNVITTLHSNIDYDLKLSHGKLIGGFVSKVWQLLLKKINKVVMLTNVQNDFFPNINNTTIIHNGRPKINDSLCNEAISLKFTLNRYRIIGSCAYIVKRKGFTQVLEFLNSSFGKEYAFVLIGDGPEKNNLIKLADNYNLSERVVFLDKKDNVYEYLRAFDYFVMSSSSEGMPLAVIEAVSMKIPVVSTSLPVLLEVFDDDEVSFFNDGNLHSLYLALRRIEQNKESFVSKSYLKYKYNYTDKVMAKKYIDLYQELKVKS